MAFSCDSSLIQVADNATGAPVSLLPTIFPFDASKFEPAVHDVPEQHKLLFDFKADKPALPAEDNPYLQALAKHAEEEEQRKAEAAKNGDNETINKIEKLSNAALLRVLQSVGATDATLVQAAKVGLDRADKLKYFKAINDRLDRLEADGNANRPDDELPPHLRRKR